MTLLQTGALLGRAVDARITFFFIGGIVLVVAAIAVAAIVSSRRSRPRTAADVQQYNSAVFKRAGRSLGLGPQHVDLLDSLVRSCKVKQPLLVFSSASLLDDTLKKGLYSLDSSRELTQDERENRRALIFQTKQILERSARKGAALRATTFLRPGQPLSITPEGGAAYSSKVISNMKDFLTVSAPAQTAGADSRWVRGTKLAVYLWRENDAGYSFVSKVLGYDTVKGVPSVLIQHSRTLRKEQRRRNRRRELMRPCFYYPIKIVETGTGRKAERKASVEQTMRTLGTVVDLSAGGCAIQTLTPFERGKLIMIEFDIDRKVAIRAFGKVMHVHRQKGRGGSMHVMFTRVTREYLNRISEFVYDFSRPMTVGQAREQMDRAVPGRLQQTPGGGSGTRRGPGSASGGGGTGRISR
jgi:c-di-GMP-binding flagellar brake protein YcgR